MLAPLRAVIGVAHFLVGGLLLFIFENLGQVGTILLQSVTTGGVTDTLILSLVDKGPIIVLLVVALIWMNKRLNKAEAKAESLTQQLIKGTQEERT